MIRRISSVITAILALISFTGVFVFGIPLNLISIFLASTCAFLAIGLCEELTPTVGLDTEWAKD